MEEGKPQIIQINEGEVHAHVDRLVKQMVEAMLNGILDAEADRLCQARRNERSSERQDTQAAHFKRKLHIKAGKVVLKVPKLRHLPFETAIIERYRRREISVEEAMIEMYLAGVSMRRVEDITEALWGTRVSPGTVSNLNKKTYDRINELRNQPIEGHHRYVYLNEIWLKRNWCGEVRNLSVPVCIGVKNDGFREVLGVVEGAKEYKESWLSFLRHLKTRGLNGIEFAVSDKCMGLIEALGEVYPEAQWQRCVVHFYRNVFTVTTRGKIMAVAPMLKAIHAQEDRKAAADMINAVAVKLEKMKLGKAAKMVREGAHETLSYYNFPQTHWRHLRTNNPLERIMRKIRRRTRVVGIFPDGESALMLVVARLRHVAGTRWGTRMYMSMERCNEAIEEEVLTTA
ncbi:MAG: IS256 family transposase [Desulfobacterales bacterium]|nr:IS256 family transposase [Desulfobacterales bacterium]